MVSDVCKLIEDFELGVEFLSDFTNEVRDKKNQDLEFVIAG